jgi:ABC-2 type transport system permease protein
MNAGLMNGTIAKLALQALLGRRRFYLLLAFPVLLIGLVGLVTALADGDAAWEIVPGLGYTLVLPLVAILAASSVLGPEVDDGSIVYLLSKPVSRYGIAISKWIVALGATLVAGTLPILVAALITGDSTRALALFVGAAVAGTTYSALFLAISAVTRHAVIASLMFVLIWESLLGNLFTGIAWLSISQWGIRIGHEISDQLPDPANLGWAIIASAVVTLVGVWFAGDRLRSFSLRGED